MERVRDLPSSDVAEPQPPPEREPAGAASSEGSARPDLAARLSPASRPATAATGGGAAAAVSGDRDRLECVSDGPGTGAETETAIALAVPPPPEPPFAQTVPTVGLAGEALERARAHNDACWRAYGEAYAAYLDRVAEAFGAAKSLEQLRAIDPEPPSEVMPRVGQTALFEKLDRAQRRLLEAKVDRGYGLLGESAPGALELVLSAQFAAGTVRASAKRIVSSGASETTLRGSVGSLEVTRMTTTTAAAGASGASGVGEAAAGAPRTSQAVGVRLDGEHGFVKADSAGNGELRVIAGPARVDANTRGDLHLELSATGTLGASASYRHEEAAFGGGVVARLSSGGIEGRLGAELQMRGLSDEDVRRALSSWLAPSREPEADAWLRRQQALELARR